MSKNKKSRKKRSPNNNNLSDITINDFANSTICKNRIKKSTGNVLKNFVEEEAEEKTWENKIDDFDGNFVQQVDEDGTVSYVISTKSDATTKCSRRKTATVVSLLNNTSGGDCRGKNYPIDVWFLISEYIRPEDVGRFAGICHTSYEVSRTAKFWYNLYKRYYRKVTNLPERLKPECLSRKYNLRTSVIRALHYLYQPYINRLRSITTFEQDPDILRRRKCILMWYKKENSQYVYYFKMKINVCCGNKNIMEIEEQRDLLEMLDDVSANRDEGCCILQVACKHLNVIPPVLGLTLTSASLSLSQGLCNHRLQLGFGSELQSYGRPSRDGNGCTIINLDPVVNVKVLNWWHPLYPYSHAIEHLLNLD